MMISSILKMPCCSFTQWSTLFIMILVAFVIELWFNTLTHEHHLPEKGRKWIEEIVKETKRRDRGKKWKKRNENREKQKVKTFPQKKEVISFQKGWRGVGEHSLPLQNVYYVLSLIQCYPKLFSREPGKNFSLVLECKPNFTSAK